MGALGILLDLLGLKVRLPFCPQCQPGIITTRTEMQGPVFQSQRMRDTSVQQLPIMRYQNNRVRVGL